MLKTVPWNESVITIDAFLSIASHSPIVRLDFHPAENMRTLKPLSSANCLMKASLAGVISKQ